MAAVITGVQRQQQTMVNLEWKEYGDVLRTGLWKLFSEQLLVDVSLDKCADFKVHRFILALFFRGLSKELASRLDCLQDIGLEDLFGCDVEDLDVVRHLFEFTYSGKVTLPVDCLDKTLSLAEAVGFDGLVISIKSALNGSSSSNDNDRHGQVPNDVIAAKEDIAAATGADGRSLDSARLLQNDADDDGHIGRRVQARRRSRKGSPIKIPYVRQTRSQNSIKTVVSEATEIKSTNRPTRKKPAPTKRPRREVIVESESDSDSVERTDTSSDNAVAADDDEEEEEEEEAEEEEEDEDDEDDDDDDEDDKEWTVASNKRKYIKKRATSMVSHIRHRKRLSNTDESSASLVNGKPKTRIKKRYRLMCDQCDYTTTDKVTYVNHQAKHDPTMNVSRFLCDLCSKTFRSRRGFRCHQKTHGGPDEQFHCIICAFNTPQKWSWRQHMAVMHKVDADTGDQLSANHRCDQCDFECVALHQLKAHVTRKHAPDKPFKCTECAYETINQSQLAKHVSVRHRKERHYMCDECGFRSQTQGGLNRHKRSHLGIKPFKCAECGMEYADSGKYKDHLVRHTKDEKPFVCHVCAHSCRRRDNLRMHLKRIHNLSLPIEGPSSVGGLLRDGAGEGHQQHQQLQQQQQQRGEVVVIEVPVLAFEQTVAALEEL